MTLKGKKVAILAEDQYQELELWYPLYRFREAGLEVSVLGTGKKTYTSKLGYPVTVDGDVHEAKGGDYLGVLVPGGFAPDFMRRHEGPVRFVREVFDLGRVVGAICHGPWILASAGVLKGRSATCYFAIKDDVVNAGARYTDREVVIDGNLVTSRKPDDLPAFTAAFLGLLEKS